MTHIISIITASFALGVWCAGEYGCLLLLLYGCSIFLVILVIWRAYNHKTVILSLGALFFVIGMVCFLHDDIVSPTDISRYAGQTMFVQGTICEIPQVILLEDGKNRVRYLVQVKKGHVLGGKDLLLTGLLSVSVRQERDKILLHFNDEIQVTSQVILLHGYNNPAQYDSVAAAQRQGIRARMTSRGNEIHSVAVNHNVSWKQKLAVWREKIISNMQRVMPEYHAAILAGMLFGGYGGIPRQIVADFSTTGIVHILSVSGSHIALVVGVITAFGTLVARRFLLHPIVVPLFAAGMVTFYAIFCGLTPPVLRSLVMGLIALVAVCFEREKDASNALLLSAFGMLIHQPALLYDLSFQLSFASTAGLVFLNAKTVEMLMGLRLPTWLAKLLAVTIAAQLGVLPFIAWYFNSLSLSSLVANVIIVPVIEWVVILGLFGAVFGMVTPVVGNIIMIICSLLIGMVVQSTSWLAAVPGAKVYMPAGGIIWGVIYYLLLAWMYGYKPKNVLSLIELIGKWPRCSATFLLVIIGCIIGYNVYPRPVTIHFIDVGQGDSALIITPHGRAILIDTGGIVGNITDFDIGERVVVPYLKHYGVLSVDYLFLTHGHEDHAGGAAAVARQLTVKNSMLPRENYTQAVNAFVRAARESVVIPIYEKQKIEIDGVVIRMIYAPSGIANNQNNEVSSVIQVGYGQHSFLLTGDLEVKGEDVIIASGQDIHSNVLKVGHHGSKTSSSANFLEQVAPEYAVISVGTNNRFGHPHMETIQRLIGQNSKIYRTDQQGAIVFTTDGRRLTVETFIKK